VLFAIVCIIYLSDWTINIALEFCSGWHVKNLHRDNVQLGANTWLKEFRRL